MFELQGNFVSFLGAVLGPNINNKSEAKQGRKTKNIKRTYAHLWVIVVRPIWPRAGGRGGQVYNQNET